MSPSIIATRLLPKPTYSSVNLTKLMKVGINKNTSKILMMSLIFEIKNIVSTRLNANRIAMWGRTRAMIKTEIITTLYRFEKFKHPQEIRPTAQNEIASFPNAELQKFSPGNKGSIKDKFDALYFVVTCIWFRAAANPNSPIKPKMLKTRKVPP